jgi:hypothetical protein
MPSVATDDRRWFDQADADKWEAVDATLFHIADVWAVRDSTTMMGATSAKIIDAPAAVVWLTSHGFDIPATLTDVAESSRLKVES